ncbi:hypothetical protein DPMN_126657 [Dreissena polymorpha]|uniref:Uncharacterized protein n=1 Tax=Dreissena polymorpha TaxID=45954 RepID=A0A9D4H0J3_DREPO|nr:hypothetical protein DPMN_133992 [Dreissena polymorpha]KAH3805691.1 hypothetical protein DPMN_133998 [Dreissena polymorpha]KAH3823338.1 hypothetical protein DPMN_125136 [Dreissena polymorpha]KAH3824804.1 hypothetical protein DPMN_126657 [Dreissena polymorpha]
MFGINLKTISDPARNNHITFDPGVRSKFQIVQGHTYAHSYHVCKFQGSSAYSVGGDSGQHGQMDGQTAAEIPTISKCGDKKQHDADILK